VLDKTLVDLVAPNSQLAELNYI